MPKTIKQSKPKDEVSKLKHPKPQKDINSKNQKKKNAKKLNKQLQKLLLKFSKL